MAAASRNPVTEEDLEHLIRDMAWAITIGDCGFDAVDVFAFDCGAIRSKADVVREADFMKVRMEMAHIDIVTNRNTRRI